MRLNNVTQCIHNSPVNVCEGCYLQDVEPGTVSVQDHVFLGVFLELPLLVELLQMQQAVESLAIVIPAQIFQVVPEEEHEEPAHLVGELRLHFSFALLKTGWIHYSTLFFVWILTHAVQKSY